MADQPEQQAAKGRHGDGADRVEFDHGAQPLARADPEQQLVYQLRRLGHHPHRDACAAADEGGQHNQPDLVGADQRAQRLRRVQHGLAERTARPMISGGRSFPGVRGRFGARDG
jgi:hypothetical protein